MDIKLIQRIDAVNADEWNHVTGTTDPFVQHALLLALEKKFIRLPQNRLATPSSLSLF